MTRLMLISLAFAAVVAVVILGFRGQKSDRPPLQAFDDMVDQPRYKAQAQGPFFADGQAMRRPPAHTVAWGRLAAQPDGALLRRDEEDFAATAFPKSVTLDWQVLQRGQIQYGIYCSVCHGGTGAGDGITTHYGLLTVPSYHDQARRQLAAGQIYRVITEGKNTMGAYGDRVQPADRWAIIAYVRALQRARNARIEDVPEANRRELSP